MNKIKTVIRSDGEDRYFTRLSNGLLQHPAIKDDTLGMLCRLLSRPANWKISVEGLVATSRSGKARVYRQISEARDLGFMRRFERRDGAGRVVEYAYVVSDNPEKLARLHPLFVFQEAGQPLTDLPLPAEQLAANPPQQKKDSYKLKKETNDKRSMDRDVRQDNFIFQGGDDPNAAQPSRKDANRYASDFVERFWSKYPRKEGKANAAKLWANMNAEDQAAAVAALPAYCNLKHVKEGLAKTGDKYLVERVYDDHAVDPAVQRNNQIKWLALDLVSGNGEQLDRASQWWPRLADVPRDLLQAATAFAAENFQLKPAPAVAWGAA